jgi:Tfp pilus assembly protein FimT
VEIPLLLRYLQALGVTVVELLVVLAIVVILTMVAIPTFLSSLRIYRVTATAQNLYYSLQLARSEAIKRNQNVYITFNATDPWCYGINVGSACTCATPSSCGLGTVSASRTEDIILTTAGLSSNSLILEGSRGATTNGKSTLTFTIYGQALAMSVAVATLGNMQLCSSTISGYQPCT